MYKQAVLKTDRITVMLSTILWLRRGVNFFMVDADFQDISLFLKITRKSKFWIPWLYNAFRSRTIVTMNN
jgi:hypothetical protein